MKPASLSQLRGIVAHAIAGGGTTPERVGEIVLLATQREAVRRATESLARYNGVLIADDVGAGKTFIALALAAAYQRVVVVAPSVLRATWHAAARRARVPIEIVSTESLGRGKQIPGAGLLVFDEAHRLRNPSTVSYATALAAAKRTHVVLLTATPIHNSPRDLDALLGLFLGPGARDLDEEGRACVVVRAAAAVPSPPVRAHAPLDVDDRDDVIAAIRALPSPFAARDAGHAPALLQLSLLRAWCSSVGAFRAMLRRALLRSAAIVEALRAGRHPTRRELSAWSLDDDAQIAFPELLASPAGISAADVERAQRHRDAVSAMRAMAAQHDELDDERANHIVAICRAHADIPVLACTQYAATVDALWKRLRHVPGAAALTARGARIASGSISRDQVLARFAPRANNAPDFHPRERVTLLITTDLVSEGLNLQDAGVVVHLDLPWTAAKIAQRVGRASRIGSPHACVHTYTLAPPKAAAAAIEIDRRLRAKRAFSSTLIGGAARTATILGTDHDTTGLSAPEARSRIVELLAHYAKDRTVPGDRAVCGVAAPRNGWLALVDSKDGPRLAARLGRGEPTTDPRAVMAAIEWLATHEEHWLPADWHRILGDAEQWISHDRARRLAHAGRTHAARSHRTAVAGLLRAVAESPPHLRAAEAARVTTLFSVHAPVPVSSPPRSLAALVVFCSNGKHARSAPL